MTDFSKVPSPCYVLDGDLLRNNLRLISNVRQESGAEIILAFKAFAMWSAFPIIREFNFKSTASSLSEARLAFEELGSRAHTFSPAYTDNEFAKIMECSSHITFNSLTQYKRFQPQIAHADHPISLGIRINPEFSVVETDLYNPCTPGSRLGIVASQLPAQLPSNISGLHIHCLCESSANDFEALVNHVDKKFAQWIKQVKWVNFGGGHLMTRKGYDTAKLIKVIKNFREKWGVDVILEPGSAFGWETGVLVSDVVDIVENNGISTAILNVSFACHMPDCLEMPYKPRIRGAHQEPISGLPTYRMGGNSCLSGDFVGDWSFDKPLQVGDKIIFEDMLHYTTVKTTMFNGVTHPSFAISDQKHGLRVVRTFGYEDYKARMS